MYAYLLHYAVEQVQEHIDHIVCECICFANVQLNVLLKSCNLY